MVDLLRACFSIAIKWLRWRLQVKMIACAAWQTFGPDHDHGRAAFTQTSGEGHRIGWFAEKIGPAPFADFRGLIGQEAHCTAFFQCLEQGAYTAKIGRRNMHLISGPSCFDQALHPRLFGRTVKHRDRRVNREVLRRNLETAQMRRQVKNPSTCAGRGFNQFPAADLDDPVNDFFLRA